MRLTKLDMARVVVTALYNLPALAPADHQEVVKRTRGTVEFLRRHYALAMKAIESRPEGHPNA
jgi:hypothetical protein